MSGTFGKGHHLHLIDGSAFIFRAYHALPPLTRKSDGLPIGAVAGFCNMLHRYVEGNTGPDAPTHVAVIFDKGHYFIIKALEYSSASRLAPLGYFEIIGSVFVGLFVFGDLPNIWTWSGIIFIVFSGLYVTSIKIK